MYNFCMQQTSPPDEFREFALVVRAALYMIIVWIEKKYQLGNKYMVSHGNTPTQKS